MAYRPDVTVAALIERAGRFLLVEERIGGRLVFNQPAGHLEQGESLPAAVIRETLEETAWHFMPDSLLGIYLWRSPRGHGILRVAFGGQVERFERERTLDPPVVRTHWLSRSEVVARASQLRTPLVLRCIDDYLSGRRLPLEALVALQAEHDPSQPPANGPR